MHPVRNVFTSANTVRARYQGHAHILQWLHCLYAASLSGGETRKHAYDAALQEATHKMLAKLSGARPRRCGRLLFAWPPHIARPIALQRATERCRFC